MLRYHGYLRKSAYEEEGGEGEGEPTVLLDSAAARLVKNVLTLAAVFFQFSAWVAIYHRGWEALD